MATKLIKRQIWDQKDRAFMRLALELAQRGRGQVEPNPIVGAVVCRNGKIVGRGYHQRFGGPHAEIFAFKEAGKKVRNSTLYVTLEPCCYTGKTGPCTKAIIAAGIRRVVAATKDPNPLVAGKGFKQLRQAGIKVEVGLYQEASEKMNRPFRKWITHARPWVIAKWAQSIDGCIADAQGDSKWISSPESRELVHELRARIDAIIVGIQTVLSDDPKLTARPKKSRNQMRTPLRVVLDSNLRMPVNSILVKTIREAPVLVVHRRGSGATIRRRIAALEKRGVQTLAVGVDKSGRLNWDTILKELGRRGCANVLVEGGPMVLGTLMAAGFMDEVWIFIAPKIAGDAKARHAVEGIKLKSIKRMIGMKIESIERCGPDILIRAMQ